MRSVVVVLVGSLTAAACGDDDDGGTTADAATGDDDAAADPADAAADPDAADPADAGAGTDGGPDAALPICGGFAGKPCARSEYCDYPDGSFCGGDDSTGVCRPRPEDCPSGGTPVCACNGGTYDNECLANADGVDVDVDGIGSGCADTFACGELTCARGAEYCYVRHPGPVADPEYECSPLLCDDGCDCFPDKGSCTCESVSDAELTVSCYLP
jgi:hypothetical protein